MKYMFSGMKNTWGIQFLKITLIFRFWETWEMMIQRNSISPIFIFPYYWDLILLDSSFGVVMSNIDDINN